MHLENKMNLKSLIKILFSVAAIFILSLTSCTTEFEKIRTSNDPKLVLKKANEYFKAGNYLDAQSLYELSIQFYRGKEEAETIFFNFAYTHYNTGDFMTASQYFSNFANTFYNSSKREEAFYMAAYAKYRMSPSFRLDQTPSVEAIQSFQDFINAYPSSTRIPETNKLIDEMRAKLDKKSFSQSLLYYDLGYFESAVRSFQNHLKDFPGSSYEAESQYLMIKSDYELATNSVIEKREERYEETIVLCNKYLEKISNRAYKKKILEILKNSKEQIKILKA